MAIVIGAAALDLPSLPQDWDSMRFFLRSMLLAALGGACLVAASPLARRFEISPPDPVSLRRHLDRDAGRPAQPVARHANLGADLSAVP